MTIFNNHSNRVTYTSTGPWSRPCACLRCCARNINVCQSKERQRPCEQRIFLLNVSIYSLSPTQIPTVITCSSPKSLAPEVHLGEEGPGAGSRAAVHARRLRASRASGRPKRCKLQDGRRANWQDARCKLARTFPWGYTKAEAGPTSGPARCRAHLALAERDAREVGRVGEQRAPGDLWGKR